MANPFFICFFDKLDSCVKHIRALNGEDDIDKIIDVGIYYWYIENTLPQNLPFELLGRETRGLLVNYTMGPHILQVINNFSKMAFRFIVNGYTKGWILIN